jgi:CspA family cold shock protein
VLLTNAEKIGRITKGISSRGNWRKEYHMIKGTIRRLMDRGYGFIKTEQDEDLFFHSNNLEGAEFNSLSEGQAVEFEKGQGRDGRPQATNVRLVGTEASDGGDKGGDESGDESGDEGGEGDS